MICSYDKHPDMHRRYRNSSYIGYSASRLSYHKNVRVCAAKSITKEHSLPSIHFGIWGLPHGKKCRGRLGLGGFQCVGLGDICQWFPDGFMPARACTLCRTCTGGARPRRARDKQDEDAKSGFGMCIPRILCPESLLGTVTFGLRKSCLDSPHCRTQIALNKRIAAGPLPFQHALGHVEAREWSRE